MKIHLEIALPDTPLFKSKVRLEVPEGATVAEVYALYRQTYQQGAAVAQKSALRASVNNAQIGFDTEVHQGDHIRIFRVLVMG